MQQWHTVSIAHSAEDNASYCHGVLPLPTAGLNWKLCFAFPQAASCDKLLTWDTAFRCIARSAKLLMSPACIDRLPTATRQFLKTLAPLHHVWCTQFSRFIQALGSLMSEGEADHSCLQLAQRLCRLCVDVAKGLAVLMLCCDGGCAVLAASKHYTFRIRRKTLESTSRLSSSLGEPVICISSPP